MRRTLVIMVKEPRPGRVKTRLGRDIGLTASAWWFRHQTAALLRRLRDPRWHVVLAVAPDRDGMQSRIWPRRFERQPQGRGDLGTRMAARLKSQPPGPVVVIGGDIPGVHRTHVAEAFAALGHAASVIGPAPDGGYWAVGLKHPLRAPSALFDGVRWSTSDAMADTLRTLPGPVARIATLADVDTAADLRA